MKYWGEVLITRWDQTCKYESFSFSLSCVGLSQNKKMEGGEENRRKIFPFYKPREIVSSITSRNVIILSVLTIKVKHFHELFSFSKCSKKTSWKNLFQTLMQHFIDIPLINAWRKALLKKKEEKLFILFWINIKFVVRTNQMGIAWCMIFSLSNS